MTITLAKQRKGYGPPTPVPIYQWADEFQQLLDFYKARKPKHVLEIGTFHGGTLYHWLTNATKGTTVVSVDSYKAGPDNRDLYQEWCRKGVTVIALQGDSHNATTAEQVRECGPYDWVWIDGGHFYNEVKTDWETYGPMCEPGGIVAFHDILPPSREHPEIQVNQLWKELYALGYTTEEIIADPDASWGGIGIVYQ